MVALNRKLSLAEHVASSLATAREDRGAIWLSTPLLYPSGAHVTTRIDGDGKHFFVSDDAGAFSEADMMGAVRTFSKIAKTIAANKGIKFDENCFFEIGVTRDQLQVAVVAIANLSKEVADRVAYRMSEKHYRFDDVQLVERLVSIFGALKVHRGAELLGASNKRWSFTASVEADGHQTIFDLVKPVWQSLLPTVAKFRDISDLPDSPPRVAVLADGGLVEQTDLNLLSRSARVIDFTARDETYRRAA
jgi:hypothetical protein